MKLDKEVVYGEHFRVQLTEAPTACRKVSTPLLLRSLKRPILGNLLWGGFPKISGGGGVSLEDGVVTKGVN